MTSQMVTGLVVVLALTSSVSCSGEPVTPKAASEPTVAPSTTAVSTASPSPTPGASASAAPVVVHTDPPPPPPSASPPPSRATIVTAAPPLDASSIDWSAVVRLDCTDAVGGPVVQVAATGDVTSDGHDEVFLVSECEGSTSSWPQVLSVYTGLAGPGGPQRLATLLSYDDGTDARGLRDIAVKTSDRIVDVSAVGYDETDPDSDPTWFVEDSFRWHGTGFSRGPRHVNPFGD